MYIFMYLFTYLYVHIYIYIYTYYLLFYLLTSGLFLRARVGGRRFPPPPRAPGSGDIYIYIYI